MDNVYGISFQSVLVDVIKDIQGTLNINVIRSTVWPLGWVQNDCNHTYNLSIVNLITTSDYCINQLPLTQSEWTCINEM